MNTLTTKIATLLLVIFLFSYFGFQSYRSLNSDYHTERVQRFEIARYCNTKGLLVRTEKALDAAPSGQVRYLLEEGQKFRQDTPIARVFASAQEADTADRQTVIRQEKALLEGIQKSTDTSKTADIEAINKEIAVTLRKLTSSSGSKDLEEVGAVHLALVEKIGRQQLVTGENTGFGERIAELDSELSEAVSGTEVYGGTVGYFSRYVDGYEAQLTPELLETIDSTTLTAMVEQEYPCQAATLGKSVTDFNWYYATVVSQEEAESFYEGAKVTMTFMGSGGSSVSGKVIHLREEPEADCAVVVIQSENVTADSVSRRVANIKISFRDYSGLRFPKKALRIVNGKQGVYVASGYSAKFKEVDIIYTGKDFYLSRTQYYSESQLTMFDEVIVEGVDLYDGKPISS